jgi:hypothetical protein
MLLPGYSTPWSGARVPSAQLELCPADMKAAAQAMRKAKAAPRFAGFPGQTVSLTEDDLDLPPAVRQPVKETVQGASGEGEVKSRRRAHQPSQNRSRCGSVGQGAFGLWSL